MSPRPIILMTSYFIVLECELPSRFVECELPSRFVECELSKHDSKKLISFSLIPKQKVFK